ncbi:hypothetical protein ACJMK2_010439 [Sinanodonta woodiana]|uniref:RGS domain-containing protein n=1 Tax=Sinanodonta woodiana TaxID=1069815 RepID=A0ABD3VFD9_SINWO
MYSFDVENRFRGRTDVPSCDTSHGVYHSDNSRIPKKLKSSKQNHTDLLKDQMWRALEFAILCTEYGNKGMNPQVVPGIDVLVDYFHGNAGGSLCIRKQPSVRNEWLNFLLKKPKIDIEKIQVSRKTICENLLVQPTKVVRSQPQPTSAMFLMRRNAVLLQRPPKPRSMEEVLKVKDQYEFFKRFMSLKNALTPLLFWREVEELKNMPYIKNRKMRVLSIFRKFFGQSTQYGAMLDCDEEIIKQLPFMDKVTPALLFCAQNAVYEVLERKWFSAYLDTFPPDTNDTRIPYPGDEDSLASAKKDPFLGRPRKGKIKISARSPKTGEGKKTTSALQTTPVVRKKTGSVLKSRLPQDLGFWMEILRYMEMVDSVKASGETSTEHAQILIDKATAIVTVYLASEVPPKVQVNITEDMASVILSSLQTIGPTRGLFHEVVMHLFPLLYTSWKTFCQQELACTLSEEYFLRLYKKITRAATTISPHKNESFPDYLHIKGDCITVIHGAVMALEESMRITFSILEGIRYFVCSKDAYDVEREREELLMGKRQKESPDQFHKQSGDGRLQQFTRADSLVASEQDKSKRRHSSLSSSHIAPDSYFHNEGHAEGDKPRFRRLSKLLDDIPKELVAGVKETKTRRGNRSISRPKN